MRLKQAMPIGNMPDLFFVDKIQRDFEIWIEANGHIYDLAVKLTRQAKAKGEKVSIELIWAVMRWKIYVETIDPPLLDEEAVRYKLNDHHTSRLARLIMEREPDLAGYFETRRLRSAFDSGSARVYK